MVITGIVKCDSASSWQIESKDFEYGDNILESNNILQNNTALCISHILSSRKIKYAVVEIGNGTFNKELFLRYLRELEYSNYQHVLVIINDIDDYVRNFGSVKFDILILGAEEIFTPVTSLSETALNKLVLSLNKSGYIIVNADYMPVLSAIEGVLCQFITIGYNSKASITTSSVGDFIENEFFLCSLQRSIKSLSKEILQPQEIKIKPYTALKEDVYNQLVTVAFAIVTDINLGWEER